LPRWVADFYPLYDEVGVSDALFSRNAWIAATVPNALAPRAVPRRSLPPRLLPLKHLFEAILGGLEPAARRFQRSIMPPALSAGGPGVVVNDEVLKLHCQDRREEHRRRFQASLVDLGLES
jgi:hypothetical protein